jgi:hypothetical protein
MITVHVPAVRVLLITRLAAWLRLSRREEAARGDHCPRTRPAPPLRLTQARYDP